MTKDSKKRTNDMEDPKVPEQLLLALQAEPGADFAAFIAGDNQEMLSQLQQQARSGGEPYLFVHGAPSTGKTHLLQSACRAAAAGGAQVQYLPLLHPGLQPAVLEGLDRLDLVALDDLQAIAGDARWEQQLFCLFNRMREQGRRLLVSSDRPLHELPIALSDLQSRLGWGPSYRLKPLDEQQMEQLLLGHAHRRGLILDSETVRYIMQHHTRDAKELISLLDALDRASLKHKKRPSRRLVRDLIARGTP